MRTVLRGLAVWVCIIFVEVLHGIARTWFLAPVIGDFHARQVAVFTGSILVVLVATMFIGWLRPANAREAAWVGIVWLVFIFGAELNTSIHRAALRRRAAAHLAARAQR